MTAQPAGNSPDDAYAAPPRLAAQCSGDELATMITDAWADVLGHRIFGLDDDFFGVGGHSLLVPRILARLRKQVKSSVTVMSFYETPTVAGLAAAMARGVPVGGNDALAARPDDAEPVLSFAQERLWLEDRLGLDEAYRVHRIRDLIGPLDVMALEASLRVIVGRHESLRTRFPLVSGQPISVVDREVPGSVLRVVDVADADDPDTEMRAVINDEHGRGFDLRTGPLFRFVLIRLGEHHHRFSVMMHHIIVDARSMAIFLRELIALYAHAADPVAAGLRPPTLHYRDFAAWQRRVLSDAVIDEYVDFWRSYLDGAPEAIALPTVGRVYPDTAVDHQRVSIDLSESEVAALREACKANAVTAFTVLMTCWTQILARWSGQPDVVVGTLSAGRDVPGSEDLMGFFVNPVPVRVDVAAATDFDLRLQQVRAACTGALAHAGVPFDILVNRLEVPRVPGQRPVFQVVLNVMSEVEDIASIGRTAVQAVTTPPSPIMFDLALTARESSTGMRLEFEFDATRYSVAMVSSMVVQFRAELPGGSTPDEPVHEPEADNSAALASTDALPAPIRIPSEFGDRVAIIDSSGSQPRSYGWLTAAAARVAQTVGDRCARRVTVVRRPRAEFVAAVIGCVNASIPVTISEPIDEPAPSSGHGTDLSLAIDPAPGGSAEAASQYHELFEDLLAQPPVSTTASGAAQAAATSAPRGKADRVAILAGSPDFHLAAVRAVVAAGATLLDAPFTNSPDEIGRWLDRAAITEVYATPSRARSIAAERPLAHLHHVVIENHGDFLGHDVARIRQIAPGSRCTGWYRVGSEGIPAATYHVPAQWDAARGPVRVPLGGGRLELRTQRHGSRAADFEVAQIYIDGRPTADLGRRHPDGTVEFVGQFSPDGPDVAQTVAAIRDVDGVIDALVLPVRSAEKTVLVGYLVGPNIDRAQLQRHLVARLPRAAIPQAWVWTDRLLLGPDGQYRTDVLHPAAAVELGMTDQETPRTPLEGQLVGIVKELIDVDVVGVHDTFFELGGFSLLATRLTSRVREIYDVDLTLKDVYQAATVDSLAQLILRVRAEALAAAGNIDELFAGIEQTAAS